MYIVIFLLENARFCWIDCKGGTYVAKSSHFFVLIDCKVGANVVLSSHLFLFVDCRGGTNVA